MAEDWGGVEGAKIMGGLRGLTFYGAMLTAKSPEEREALKSELRDDMEAVQSSDRTIEECIAWAEALAAELNKLAREDAPVIDIEDFRRRKGRSE